MTEQWWAMDTPATPQYFPAEGAEHIRLFRCEPLRASLTPASCAKRYAEQMDYPCADCAVGALHAARLGFRVTRDRTRAAHTRPCCRCRRHEFRLIGSRLCISCWNREREWKVGRNRKGGRPTIPLQTWETLMAAPGGLGTRQLSGIAVQDLGSQDYAMTMAALNEAEVERVIKSIWPAAEIVVIGPAARQQCLRDKAAWGSQNEKDERQPPEAANNQRRSSAMHMDLSAESCTA